MQILCCKSVGISRKRSTAVETHHFRRALNMYFFSFAKMRIYNNALASEWISGKQNRDAFVCRWLWRTWVRRKELNDGNGTDCSVSTKWQHRKGANLLKDWSGTHKVRSDIGLESIYRENAICLIFKITKRCERSTSKYDVVRIFDLFRNAFWESQLKIKLSRYTKSKRKKKKIKSGGKINTNPGALKHNSHTCRSIAWIYFSGKHFEDYELGSHIYLGT